MNRTLALLMLLLLVALSGSHSELAAQSTMVDLLELDSTVEVTFDQYGIPRIYARTAHDLFLMQGYLQAQDRWWQMDVARHRGAGQLAELLGADYVESDTLIRQMGLPAWAAHDLADLPAEDRALLDAYVVGVNAWLREQTPETAALEYTFLGGTAPISLEAWTPLDTLLLQSLQAFGSDQTNLAVELIKTQIVRQQGALVASVVVPPYPSSINPTIIPADAESTVAPVPTNIVMPISPLKRFALPDLDSYGSNSWVVSGALTESGRPLLANDSHWGIQLPSVWYEVGLYCVEITTTCPYSVFGFSFAGAPGIIVGHNQQIAWGFTSAFTDTIDVFLLDLNPDDPTAYWVDDAYQPLITHTETIQVRDGDPVAISITRSDFGMVFDRMFGVNLGTPVAVRSAGSDGNRSFRGILALNRAADWQTFTEALGYMELPGLHVVYADVAGNIGYVHAGHIPLRSSGSDGSVALTANDSRHSWQGYVDPVANPRAFNPPEGYIVTANNATASADAYPFALTFFQDYGYRAARIDERLRATGMYMVDSMSALQLDNYNPAAAILLPTLSQIAFSDERLREAVEWMAEWDFQNTAENPQAALFNVFWTHLLHLALEELPLYEGSHTIYLLSQMLNGVHPLWVNTERGYSLFDRDRVLTDALSESMIWVEQRLGEDRAEWRWGALHIARFTGDLSADPAAARVFDHVVPASGGWASVNTSEWNIDALDYGVTKIASMRMILDVGAFENSRVVNSTGQSGDPTSPYYVDQLALWRDGYYRSTPIVTSVWNFTGAP